MREGRCSSWWWRETAPTRARWSAGKGREGRDRAISIRSVPWSTPGNVLVGGAILSEDGEMTGSMLLVEFPDREGVDAWLAGDPYVTNGVWQDVQVQPFRTAVGAWQP